MIQASSLLHTFALHWSAMGFLIIPQWVSWPRISRSGGLRVTPETFPISVALDSNRRKPMLRKSLIAFTAATVVGVGSQAEAAGFSHAMSAPEIPIATLDRKGLIGKRMYDHSLRYFQLLQMRLAASKHLN
jgi:hypothetical protein